MADVPPGREPAAQLRSWLRDRVAGPLSVGANATLVGAAAGLALIGLFDHASARDGAAANARGAAVLSDAPDVRPGRRRRSTRWRGITPNPLRGPRGRARPVRRGLPGQPSSPPTVHTCSYGDPDAATTIAVVGDSKAAQWVPAFQLLAEPRRLVDPHLHQVGLPVRDRRRSPWTASVYQTCRDWTDNVLDKLTGADRPDVVVTAGQRSAGRRSSGEDGDLELSGDAMQDASVDTWGRARGRRRARWSSLADTPQTFIGRLRVRRRAPRRPDRLHLRPGRGIATSGRPRSRPRPRRPACRSSTWSTASAPTTSARR